MKKVILALVVLAMLATPVFGTQDQFVMVNDYTLAKTTPTKEADRNIENADRVTFFITYDSSRTTAAVTATVTAAVSIDGTNWQDISWFDVAGGVTPQTTETLSTDSTYVGWLDSRITAKYIRIRTILPNYAVYGAGDTADLTVTLSEKK